MSIISLHRQVKGPPRFARGRVCNLRLLPFNGAAIAVSQWWFCGAARRAWLAPGEGSVGQLIACGSVASPLNIPLHTRYTCVPCGPPPSIAYRYLWPSVLLSHRDAACRLAIYDRSWCSHPDFAMPRKPASPSTPARSSRGWSGRRRTCPCARRSGWPCGSRPADRATAR